MCSPSGVADADPGVPAEVAAAGAHDRPQEAAVGERMRVARAVELGPLREEADLGRQVRPAVAAVAGRRRGDVPAGHRLRAAERQVDQDPAEHQLDVVVGDPGEAAHRQAEPARVGVQRRRGSDQVAPSSSERGDDERRLVAQVDPDHVREAHQQPAGRFDPDHAGRRPPAGRRVGEQRPRLDDLQRSAWRRAWGVGSAIGSSPLRCEWSEQDARDALVPAAGDGRLVVDGDGRGRSSGGDPSRSRRGRRRRALSTACPSRLLAQRCQPRATACAGSTGSTSQVLPGVPLDAGPLGRHVRRLEPDLGHDAAGQRVARHGPRRRVGRRRTA